MCILLLGSVESFIPVHEEAVRGSKSAPADSQLH